MVALHIRMYRNACKQSRRLLAILYVSSGALNGQLALSHSPLTDCTAVEQQANQNMNESLQVSGHVVRNRPQYPKRRKLAVITVTGTL